MTQLPVPYTRERLVAELAVQRAAVLTKRVLRSYVGDGVRDGGALEKSDATPVTVADFAAQALLISAVHRAFPGDGFIGEESAGVLRKDPALGQRVWELVSSTHLDDADSEGLLAGPTSLDEMLDIIDLGSKGTGGRSGRLWMMDPLDGTAAFLRGEQYAISLALIEDGKQVVGALGCPNLDLRTGRVAETIVDEKGYGIMLSAVRGQGAVMRPIGTGRLQPGHPIPRLTDGPADLRDLHFVDSSTSKAWWHEKARQVGERVGGTNPWTDLWSSHMRYAALIVGGGDVNLRIPRRRGATTPVWDHAGTHLIFTEAGGRITDLHGREVDFGLGRDLGQGWGVIAARAGVHGRILEAVREVLKGANEE